MAGDLRIPHFVGMHALQIIPLAALLLEVLARRIPAVAGPRTRFRLLWVVIGLYLGVLALLTGQAVAGQSIVRPDPLVTVIAALLFGGAVVAAAAILSGASRDRDRNRDQSVRPGSRTAPPRPLKWWWW